jgi:predicted NBD/HSP70 family sugar kinase
MSRGGREGRDGGTPRYSGVPGLHPGGTPRYSGVPGLHPRGTAGVPGSRTRRLLEVLSFVRELGEASRGDIAEALDLDKKTVSTLVGQLAGQSLLRSAGFRESQAGRRQELLAVRGSHSCFLGIDLGATHIIGILTDLNAAVLDRIDFEIRPGLPVELILSQIRSIARGLLASGKAVAAVKSVGVAVPGFVNPQQGISLVAENIPGWRDVRLKEILEGELGLPVEVDDCSRAFGRAERWLGHGRNEPNFLLLDLGYGIGMAVFIRGEPYTGSGYKSGEIGHTVVRLDGPPCSCGKRGCLEALASGRGVACRAAAAVREGRSAVLAGLTHGNAETVTAQDVAVAASMGDPFANGLLREAGSLIGVALANAVNLLNPSLAVIGGGLAGAGTPLLEGIRESLARYTMMGIAGDLRLELSRLGPEASALGGALLAMEHVFSP